MLYTLHYITALFHVCKIQWNIIKDEMRCITFLAIIMLIISGGE